MTSTRLFLVTLLLLFGLAVVLVSCTQSDETRAPNLFGSPCRFGSDQQVEVNGNTFEPLWGPMRTDILRTSAFSETQLIATDRRECPAPLPSNIHEIAGVPLEKVFVEIRHTKNTGSSNHTFPLACHFTNEVYTFTAVGATEPLPPFGRSPATPWSEGSPTPVPTAPVDGPIVDLSSEGLLKAGWPYMDLRAPNGNKVYWDSGIRVRYKDRVYEFSNNHTLNGGSGRFELATDMMDEIDTISIQYSENRWPEGLTKSMPHLLTDGKVEDRIRLLRPLDRSQEEVIIVDPCPTFPNNLQPDNVVFWARIQPSPVTD